MFWIYTGVFPCWLSSPPATLIPKDSLAPWRKKTESTNFITSIKMQLNFALLCYLSTLESVKYFGCMGLSMLQRLGRLWWPWTSTKLCIGLGNWILGGRGGGGVFWSWTDDASSMETGEEELHAAVSISEPWGCGGDGGPKGLCNAAGQLLRETRNSMWRELIWMSKDASSIFVLLTSCALISKSWSSGLILPSWATTLPSI